MGAFRTSLIAVAIASLAAGAGYLYAQPADGEGDDVGAALNTTANISPSEMRTKSDEVIKQMQTALTRVLQLQQSARKTKDIIKLNCVNEKLLQVKQLLNIAEGARTDLIEAIANRDEDGRYHQFSQITISGEKVSTLRDEAEACIGEELIFVGPTEVEVDEPDIPDDPTDDDYFDYDDLDPDVERPGYASPYL